MTIEIYWWVIPTVVTLAALIWTFLIGDEGTFGMNILVKGFIAFPVCALVWIITAILK